MRFLITVGFLFALSTGLTPTIQRLRLDYRSIRSNSYEDLRRDKVTWYRRLESCFRLVSEQVGEDEILLLAVDNVPHWFAPYYLAPRSFYYLSPEVEAKIRKRGLHYRRLYLTWAAGHVKCELSEPMGEEGTKGP